MYYGHISLESLVKSFDNPSFLNAGFDKNKIDPEIVTYSSTCIVLLRSYQFLIVLTFDLSLCMCHL